MKEVILIKMGEIALKGLNRGSFEDILVKNIRWRLRPFGKFEIQRSQSTITVRPLSEDVDLDEVCEAVGKVFGIAAYSRALVTEKDFAVIRRDAVEYLRDAMEGIRTFKVEAKRSDKSFPHKSPEISAELGGDLLEAYPHLKVDVRRPDMTVMVEIRDFAAYIHGPQVEGAGGMPVSSSGRAMLLVSGGIDSPVAGYMMARRGLKLSAMHFVSPPYTSDRALDKVETLLKTLTGYTGNITFYCVPFTKIQEALRDNCPEELFTIIMRRLMMEIAVRIARREDIPALITGESLGQVASQTLLSLAATNAASDRPVFRPLIGMDKKDIIKIAREIGTFETSILPYEDCCTVFTPKRPKTRPTLQYVEESQNAFDFEPLIEEAVQNIEEKVIRLEW